MFPNFYLPSSAVRIPDEDVLILLHGEGSDGGSVITDSSTYNMSPSSNNGVVTKTDSYKFGASSLFHDGKWISYTAAASGNRFDFDNVDEWTIEFFCRSEPAASIVNDHQITLYRDANNFMSIHIDPAVEMSMYKYVGGAAVAASTGVVPDTSRWYHRCIMKKGGRIYGFLDGVPAGSMAGNWWASPGTTLTVGTLTGSFTTWYYHGWIDELRIIRNLALYPLSGFAVPAAAFPDP